MHHSPTPGGDIVALAKHVTALYSTNDDILPWAQKVDKWLELGLNGPPTGSPLYANFSAVDCSSIVDEADTKKYPPPSGVKIQTHTAYFYIPETLQEMAAALMGT
ncbi:MAG: hypothetical protein U0271_12300 [Polyangiaceae bacterium]